MITRIEFKAILSDRVNVTIKIFVSVLKKNLFKHVIIHLEISWVGMREPYASASMGIVCSRNVVLKNGLYKCIIVDNRASYTTDRILFSYIQMLCYIGILPYVDDTEY